jgi:hypothetical protein
VIAIVLLASVSVTVRRSVSAHALRKDDAGDREVRVASMRGRITER